MPTKDEIRAAAIKEYQNEYEDMTDVRSTEVVMGAFGGNLAVVEAKNPAGYQESEVTFVDDKLNVTLFATTKELVRFLQGAERSSFLNNLASRANIAALICLIALAGVFAAGFTGNFRPESLAIVGSVVAAAAGFLFGTSKSTT